MSYYTRFSACASLGAVAMHVRQKRIWKVVERRVDIQQKVIKHRPIDKLKDCFITILCGGQRLVEVNTRLRPDVALQRAFGRKRCADQSTVSDTVNACTAENVLQMRAALQDIYRTHSQGYAHDYQRDWQILDVDMSGMPAGRQGEGVEKGYFAGHKNQRGRQLGRVVASRYDEIVVEYLYPGKTQLEKSLQPLVLGAEEVLALDQARRQQTIIRSDGGGGRDEDVNWLLERGYLVMLKAKNWKRASKLAKSVKEWHLDPKTQDREVGWVEEPHLYSRPTRQLAIRMRVKDKWQYRVLVFNLSDERLFWLVGRPVPHHSATTDVLFAALHSYDLRSGGVETSLRGSKQGVGLTKRNKRRFEAQEMLVLLAQLAYNLLTWIHDELARQAPKLASLGKLRLVRDLFHIPGQIRLDAQERVLEITLAHTHPLAAPLVQVLSSTLAQDDMMLNLGQI
jgi:hypothetical protein